MTSRTQDMITALRRAHPRLRAELEELATVAAEETKENAQDLLAEMRERMRDLFDKN
jgi:hypothetical protein